jgi:hypothetical protein
MRSTDYCRLWEYAAAKEMRREHADLATRHRLGATKHLPLLENYSLARIARIYFGHTFSSEQAEQAVKHLSLLIQKHSMKTGTNTMEAPCSLISNSKLLAKNPRSDILTRPERTLVAMSPEVQQSSVKTGMG